MTRRFWLLAGILIAGCALGAPAARPGQAQTPPSAAPSPEEALLGILPYELQPSDVPAGFHLVTLGATSPSELAFAIGTSQDDAQQALQEIRREGLQVSVVQEMVPDINTALRLFDYHILLFASPAQASAALHDRLGIERSSTRMVDNPPLPVQLGDESGAVHIVTTHADRSTDQEESVAWRRDRVLLVTNLGTIDSTESLDQLVPVAQAADQRAASVTPPPPASRATLPVIGDESYRVDAIFALGPRLPTATQAPIGLRPAGGAVLNNANLLLYMEDPVAGFARIAQTWKRIVGVERAYGTLQGQDGEVVRTAYTLSADVAGARAMMLDPEFARTGLIDFTRAPDARSFAAYSLPHPLGDDGRIYYAAHTSDRGVPLDIWEVVWLRGRVVISVTISAPGGTTSAQDAAGFAAQVDARYNRGAVPDVLTVPLPGVVTPAVTPTPGPVFGR